MSKVILVVIVGAILLTGIVGCVSQQTNTQSSNGSATETGGIKATAKAVTMPALQHTVAPRLETNTSPITARSQTSTRKTEALAMRTGHYATRKETSIHHLGSPEMQRRLTSLTACGHSRETW
jgi:hypothetical protein